MASSFDGDDVVVVSVPEKKGRAAIRLAGFGFDAIFDQRVGRKDHDAG